MKITFCGLGLWILALFASSSAFAGSCCVDGSCVYSTTLNTGTIPFLTGLCTNPPHTISGSGATCTVIMQQDESVNSGNCVTISDRATLDMNGHVIQCTGSCGTAINNTDTTTSNPVKILGGGSILGCWTNAATSNSDAYNSTITDVHIDLTGSCSNTNGIGPYKTVTRVSVGGATGYAVDAGASTSIVDSIIHNSTVGVKVRGNPPDGTSISGSLIYNSSTNIQAMSSVNANGGPQTLSGSTVLSAPCQFKDLGGNCGPAVNVIDLNGTNFIEFSGPSYEIVQ